MTDAIGCNLATLIFSYNCFKKNEDTRLKEQQTIKRTLFHNYLHVSLTLFEANVDVNECFRMLVMVLNQLRLRDFIYRSSQSSSLFVLQRYQWPGHTKQDIFKGNSIQSTACVAPRFRHPFRRLGNPMEDCRKIFVCAFISGPCPTFDGGNASMSKPSPIANEWESMEAQGEMSSLKLLSIGDRWC